MTTDTQASRAVEPRTLAAMHRRPTRWEVAAHFPDGTRLIFGYTARVTRSGLLSLAQQHAEAILPYVSEEDPASYSAARGLQLGPVRIAKTGRTEHTARVEIDRARAA